MWASCCAACRHSKVLRRARLCPRLQAGVAANRPRPHPQAVSMNRLCLRLRPQVVVANRLCLRPPSGLNEQAVPPPPSGRSEQAVPPPTAQQQVAAPVESGNTTAGLSFDQVRTTWAELVHAVRAAKPSLGLFSQWSGFRQSRRSRAQTELWCRRPLCHEPSEKQPRERRGDSRGKIRVGGCAWMP